MTGRDAACAAFTWTLAGGIALAAVELSEIEALQRNAIVIAMSTAEEHAQPKQCLRFFVCVGQSDPSHGCPPGYEAGVMWKKTPIVDGRRYC
jgi:hypothetical protein